MKKASFMINMAGKLYTSQKKGVLRAMEILEKLGIADWEEKDVK